MKKSFVRAERRREGEIRYKHDLGQHFLYDTALLRSLVDKAGVRKTDRVLEIGPGAGTLTVCLCEAAERVLAVEVDEAVLPFLRIATEGLGNLQIVQGDIRRLNLPALAATLGGAFKVVANIPYNITTPIFDLFWGSGLAVTQLAVMVQREVAEKLVALPGDAAYGLMSVRSRYYCEPEILAHVPAEAFTPPPKVDSAFVSLVFREQPYAPVADEPLLWRVIQAGFAQRRKTLLNALKSAVPHPPDTLRGIWETLALSPTVRGEVLTLPQWIALANALAAVPRTARYPETAAP